MEYTIFFPTPWDQVNVENDNIDVCLTFLDGRNYTFVVTTPENIQSMMEQDRKSYLVPATPMLIAKELTPDVVKALIAELVQDKHLLNCYGSDYL